MLRLQVSPPDDAVDCASSFVSLVVLLIFTCIGFILLLRKIHQLKTVVMIGKSSQTPEKVKTVTQAIHV